MLFAENNFFDFLSDFLTKCYFKSQEISNTFHNHKYYSNGCQDNFEENDLICNKSALIWINFGEISSLVFKKG